MVVTALGSYIKAARKAAGLSQEELEGRIRFSQASISMWETGQAVPTALAMAELDRELPEASAKRMLELLSEQAASA